MCGLSLQKYKNNYELRITNYEKAEGGMKQKSKGEILLLS